MNMDTHGILSALREGARLVTVNKRLSRHWRKRFAQHAAEGASLWPTPDILPWGAWLRRLWDEASWLDAEAPLLLEPMQDALLWQKIIEREASPLLQARASARLAREAWRLVCDWRAPMPFEPLECNDDVLAFQGWAGRFVEACARRGWLDEARLTQTLVETLNKGRVKMPRRLILLGFDDWTPAQRALLDALAAGGTRLDFVESGESATAGGLGGVSSGARRVTLADAAREDEAAARWARARLEAEPAARLAIIAPDLQDRRARLTRLLDAQLAPQRLLPGGQALPRPWNISLGLPLREHGMVQSALRVFDLGESRLALETLGQALRCPFLAGYAEEREARALLDARLRERGESRLASLYVRKLAAEGGCPRFGRSLAALAAARAEQAARLAPTEWTARLGEELRLAGWPGDGELSSADFQLRQAWLEAMHSLTALELVQARMSRGEFLSHLRALAAETLFQPEADNDASVQVLGPLEALGLNFDGVWLLGMQHEQWPPQARPNPYLPLRLQARLGMPHASPARELAYARRVSARLLALADEVIVSHAQQDAGRELEPSPLFETLPELALGELPQSALPLPGRWGGSESARMTFIHDAEAPSLEIGARVRGGARLLELQSACPFRAFAELRLGAEALGEPELGPDAMARGTLLHRTLELLWGELGDQAGLLAHDEESLRTCVQAHARAAVDEQAQRRRSLWPERLQALEMERLTALVLEWLEIERARPPFTVEAREQKRSIEIGGLRLEVKIDRIDRVGGKEGGRLMMDYKTGQASPAHWAGERPQAPQLPLYAALTEQTRAIAFAQVRAGEMAFSGLADARMEDVELATVEQDWDEVLGEYRRVLTSLADAFRAGRAAVDPRDQGGCAHCPLTALCRIHERAGFDLLHMSTE